MLHDVWLELDSACYVCMHAIYAVYVVCIHVVYVMCILSSRSDWMYNCTNCHDAVLCTNSRAVLGSLHTQAHCSSFCSACVMELGSTYTPSSA